MESNILYRDGDHWAEGGTEEGEREAAEKHCNSGERTAERRENENRREERLDWKRTVEQTGEREKSQNNNKSATSANQRREPRRYVMKLRSNFSKGFLMVQILSCSLNSRDGVTILAFPFNMADFGDDLLGFTCLH